MEHELRVIRFDRTAPVPADAPTPFGPWRTWITGNYRLCRSLQEFQKELAEAPGRVILLLHFSDLYRDLLKGDVDTILDDPRRTAFVYSGGKVDSDRVASPRHAGRWAAVGDEHLCGHARPAAWQGADFDHGVELTDLARPFHIWRQKAASPLVCGVRYEEPNEGDFLPRLISGPIDVGKPHGLNTDGAHPRTAEERRSELHYFGDRLWLLYGVAASLFWRCSETLITEVLSAITDLLRRGTDLDDKNDPSARRNWNDIVARIDHAIITAQERA